MTEVAIRAELPPSRLGVRGETFSVVGAGVSAVCVSMDAMNLYTKNGRPLQVSGDSLYSRSGTYLGSISNGKVYDPSGRYAGTVDGDRVVYRSSDSASVGSSTISGSRAGVASANVAGSALWGDEPPFPD